MPPRTGDRGAAGEPPRTALTGDPLAATGSPPDAPLSPIAALLVVQILFGVHYVAAKIVVEEIPPSTWAVLRAASGALVLIAAAVIRREPLRGGMGSLVRLAGLSLIGVAINQLLFVEGISRTTPGHSSVINTSIPVLTLAFAVILGRERPTGRHLAGIATTLAGVFLLIGPAGARPLPGSLMGDLLTLCNAASFSLFLVLGKSVLERERTVPATGALLGFGALWLMPIGASGLASLETGSVSPRTWALGAFIIIGPTVGAYALNNYALRRVESSLVAFFVYLQPVLGTAASLALGMESLTPTLAAGGIVVGAGVWLVLRSPRTRRADGSTAQEPKNRNRG